MRDIIPTDQAVKHVVIGIISAHTFILIWTILSVMA